MLLKYVKIKTVVFFEKTTPQNVHFSLWAKLDATSKSFESNGPTRSNLVFLHIEWSALTVSHHLVFFRFELTTNHTELLFLLTDFWCAL